VACNIPLESFQLVVGPQSHGVPAVGILGLPFGSLEIKWHLGVGLVAKHKVYYKGKVVASPKYGLWWVLWVRVCPWLVRASKCYNYAPNLILIRGLHVKLWAPKVEGILVVGISGLPLGSLRTKWHLGVGPMARHIVYYIIRGEGDGFPQVRAMMSLVNPCLLVARPCTKVLQL
jgi:hypothetical protein